MRWRLNDGDFADDYSNCDNGIPLRCHSVFFNSFLSYGYISFGSQQQPIMDHNTNRTKLSSSSPKTSTRFRANIKMMLIADETERCWNRVKTDDHCKRISFCYFLNIHCDTVLLFYYSKYFFLGLMTISKMSRISCTLLVNRRMTIIITLLTIFWWQSNNF